MDISKIWQYDLRKGNTDHPANGACLFDAGMWLVYGKIGDNPPCSCPIIRSYAIGLNDSMDDKTRQLLKPFILRVVGNRDPEAEASRLHHIVLETARRVVPLASNLSQFAALRNLPDNASYKEIRDAARAAHAAHAAYTAFAVGAGDAAAAAARAADAAARAARAAYAAAHADAHAAAAAGAADAAFYAMDSCQTAHADAHTAAAVWQESINILNGALRIGKQAPEFDEEAVHLSVKAFAKARESTHAR